jgi:hypothetical protein
MVLPKLLDLEGLNAGTYDPYETKGGSKWREKINRHNATAMIVFMRKQHWMEFGEMGPHLRDRVLGMHQETNRHYTNNNYRYTQLYPMKACDGCKNTSADDHVNNRRKYSSNISMPCEFPSNTNVLSGWH